MRKVIRPKMAAFLPTLIFETLILGAVGAGCYHFVQLFESFSGYEEVYAVACGLYLFCLAVFIYRSVSEIFARRLVISGNHCTLYTGMFVLRQVHTTLELISGYEVNSNFIQKFMGYGDVTIYFIGGYFTLRGISLEEVKILFDEIPAENTIIETQTYQ